MATPGRMPCDMASPSRLDARATISTPSGAPPKARAMAPAAALFRPIRVRRHGSCGQVLRGRDRFVVLAPGFSQAVGAGQGLLHQGLIARPPGDLLRARTRVLGQSRRARSRSCSTAITVRPWTGQPAMSSPRSSAVRASIPLNGSSSSTSWASCTSTRANRARCSWPPDTAPIGRCSSPCRPTAATAAARRSRSLRSSPPNRPRRPMKPETDQIKDAQGKLKVQPMRLGQIGDLARRHAAAVDRAGQGLEMSRQGHQQGGLARAVGPTTAVRLPDANRPDSPLTAGRRS